MSREVIPLSRPDLAEADIEAVQAVLRGDRLSLGPRLEAFEAAVAARAGRRYGIGVNSGTSGLHLCVAGLGIGSGQEVITTPFSFVATTNCILYERATPVFVDIDPESYNMDPEQIEGAITGRTKAILPAEVFGNTAHFDEYERIAAEHNLLLIEDCCEALGGWLADRAAGSFGTCGVFAFYPNKQITTGEGGVIVTDRDELRDACVCLRNQGHAAAGEPLHERLGFNYRMSELHAALGEMQIRRLDEILEKRRRAARLYEEALSEVAEVRLPPMADRQRASWFVYVIRLAQRFGRADRDAIVKHLRAQGVDCRPYFHPIHMQPYVAEMLGTGEGDFPQAERVAARTIALPFFSDLTEDQVAAVKKTLCDALTKYNRQRHA